MYCVKSPRCNNKNCLAWMPLFPEVPDSFPLEIECPTCKQRLPYKPHELLIPRPVAGNQSDGPLFPADMRWQRIRFESAVFFIFASEKDPVESGVRSISGRA